MCRRGIAGDTDPEMGGFQCVPELFRTLEAWRKTQPADRDGFVPDVTGFDVVNVTMNAGDLLIFNSLLAHGIRPNRSIDRVRMAQYISMTPPTRRMNPCANGASNPGVSGKPRPALPFPAIRAIGKRRGMAVPISSPWREAAGAEEVAGLIRRQRRVRRSA